TTVTSITSVWDFYQGFNPATLSGAIDIIVVERSDGSLQASPFHVRFGKLKLLRPQEKRVEISVNGVATGLFMKLGDAGEAFFVVESDNLTNPAMATSPISKPMPDDTSNIDSFQLDTPTLNIQISAIDEPTDANGYVSAQGSEFETGDFPLAEVLSPIPIDESLQLPDAKLDVYDSNPSQRLWKFDKSADKDDYPFSDNELEADENDLQRSKGPSSDTDIEYRTEQPDPYISPPPSGWSWSWGSLPHQPPLPPKKEVLVTIDSSESLDTEISVNEKVDTFLKGLEKERKSIVSTAEDLGQDWEDADSEMRIEVSLCSLEKISKADEKSSDEIFSKSMIEFQSDKRQRIPTSSIKKLLPTKDSKKSGFSGFGLWPWGSGSGPAKKTDSDIKTGDDQIVPQSLNPTDMPLQTPRSASTSRSPSPNDHDRASLTAQASSSLHEDDTEAELKHYVKSLRLTSDQLISLNLQKGVNHISFTVMSRLQGKASTSSRIFFWDASTKVVISDVDGTITKSDVLGHMFTAVGRDWTHPGIANLYTNIRNNGYNIMYLTSRAIGQAEYTREYLKKVQQKEYQLPEGPVIMSPDRLFRALHREVVIRKPEEFKIACLRDIKRLWGDNNPNPFYAGFGNRITDALSYRSVDVPSSRIFTINPTGEVKLELLSTYKSTYMKLNDIVDQLFPPISKSINTDYNDFNFWRMPMLDLPEVSTQNILGTSPSALSTHSTPETFDQLQKMGGRSFSMPAHLRSVSSPATVNVINVVYEDEAFGDERDEEDDVLDSNDFDEEEALKDVENEPYL
ncbi:hypothetical protein HK096_004285, partial [Nowakowskiella sp. JEL0078]